MAALPFHCNGSLLCSCQCTSIFTFFQASFPIPYFKLLSLCFFVPTFELFFLLDCLMTSFLPSTGRSLDCLLYSPVLYLNPLISTSLPTMSLILYAVFSFSSLSLRISVLVVWCLILKKHSQIPNTLEN